MTDDAKVTRPYQDHFAKLHFRVLDDKQVTNRGLAAYTALARFADFDTGESRVSRQKLADKARVSVKTIDRGITELVELGHLEVERIQKIDGSWAASIYRLMDTAAAVLARGGSDSQSPPPGDSQSPPPSDSQSPGVAPHSPQGGDPGATPKQETSNKRQKNENPSPEGEGHHPDPFDEFWAVYPRRVEKIAAQKAWTTALKRQGVTAALVIAAAGRYAQSMVGKDREYVKHPASWLRAGAYEDFPETPAKTTQPAGSPRPAGHGPWCGECDEISRLIYPEGRESAMAAPCPTCHRVSVRKAANQ